MTPRALQAAALAWRSAGVAAVVVQVHAVRGSVPREAGALMLVSTDSLLGTIGGGHLEWQAIAEARAALQRGGAGLPAERAVALGPSLGQCCGGALLLQQRWLADEAPQHWVLPAPRLTLQLHGAGHVGRAVVKLLADIDCSVRWVDERAGELPVLAPALHIECVASDDPVAEVAAAAEGTAFLVMTHRHDLDLALAQAVLARPGVRWFGLIGSATKRARFEARLRQRGVDAAALSAMVCPIGDPAIDGKEAAVIAVAVVAQLLALKTRPLV